jgi:Kef-type K+ transport system membrane component KefB
VAGVVLGPAVLDLVRPDQTVEALSVIGLSFLLFLAGLEIDVGRWQGPLARRVATGLAGTVVLAVLVGWALGVAGVVENTLLVGVALVATSLGLLVPILKDADAVDRPVGQLIIGGASAGEFCAVGLLSLFFSEHASGPASRLLLLLGLACLTALVVVTSMRAGRSMWLSRTVARLADTSAQIRIRLTMVQIDGLSAVAAHLGFEAILGAFIAGAVLRMVDPDAERTHPRFHIKLEGLGYGFLVPVFFVTSGIQFDLDALFANAGTVLRVPLFLAALLLVRGLPVLASRTVGLSRAELGAAGLLQATSLPFIVAATTIGLKLDAIQPDNAAALVAAGLVSVIVFPLVALPLLSRGRGATDVRSVEKRGDG